MWEGGKLPQSWKEAVVVSVYRAVKDYTNPGRYGPIASTSKVCKIMEKMLNERLTYYAAVTTVVLGRNTMGPV